MRKFRLGTCTISVVPCFRSSGKTTTICSLKILPKSLVEPSLREMINPACASLLALCMSILMRFTTGPVRRGSAPGDSTQVALITIRALCWIWPALCLTLEVLEPRLNRPWEFSRAFMEPRGVTCARQTCKSLKMLSTSMGVQVLLTSTHTSKG